MPNRPITILGVNSDNSLELSDRGNTVANPGDTITWHIGHNSNVTSITSILPKAGSANVFNPVPGPLANSSNWQGTIDPAINSATEEDYSIGYTTTSGGYVFDPKIQVNPSPLQP